ncbi:hypothetical protein ACFQ3C_11125 [Seohaeicola saemankumensis]|uniref:Uncharacterized protein n=1 Tax=Seohaeicola saemankumensis TaxID=481181 RepID=A0ABW3TDG1_9RHOB
MLGFRSITGTGACVYTLMAFTKSDPLWVRYTSLQTLHEVFIIWMLAAVFVGVINWIFQ